MLPPVVTWPMVRAALFTTLKAPTPEPVAIVLRVLLVLLSVLAPAPKMAKP